MSSSKPHFYREKSIAGVGWAAKKRGKTYWFVKMSDGWSVWGPSDNLDAFGPDFRGCGFKSREEAYNAIE